jgi:DNA-damage-inducible protein J
MINETSIVRARVAPKLKDDAELVLSSLGVSMSDAIRMYLTQITLRRGIPFSIEIPNTTTLDAMREAEAGKTGKAENVADLFAKLRK